MAETRHSLERDLDRAREHGYDTKYAMHALRIAYQGIELLTTGRITLPMPEPERTALRQVRSGRVGLDDVLAHLDRVTAQLADATADPALPPASDVETVDRFVVDAYRSAWDAGLHAPSRPHGVSSG